MVKSQGSRKRVSLLLKQAKETFKEGREYTQLFISRAAEAKEETDELLRQVHYQQLIEEAEEQVEEYLKERESVKESESSETRSREGKNQTPIATRITTEPNENRKGTSAMEDPVDRVEAWIRESRTGPGGRGTGGEMKAPKVQ